GAISTASSLLFLPMLTGAGLLQIRIGRLHHVWGHSARHSWHSAAWGAPAFLTFRRDDVIYPQEHAGGFCGGFDGLLFHPERFNYVVRKHVSDLACLDLDSEPFVLWVCMF